VRQRTLQTTKNARKDLKGYRAEVKAQNPDYYHEQWIKHYYKMSLISWKQLYHQQNGVCALCFGLNTKGKRLCVDHDHDTGKIRGLLCTRCNITLGKHETKWFVRAIAYLNGLRLPDEQPKGGKQ
jgi:hypothetical protein